ncbi:MAG: protein-disulfide reductase DsbD domain-containing protein [Edaphobacter sp.]
MNILRPISALLLAGALIFHPSADAQLQVVGDGGPGPVKAQHLTAELVSLAPDIAPGGTLQVGLVLTLEEHWHVYWINAGDSGEPPKVTWTLPDGITAGPMKFPIPSRLPLGPLMDFGYEDEVAFPIQLTAAGTLKPGPHPPRRHRQLARLPRGLHSRQGQPRPQPDRLPHRPPPPPNP